jgi:hypothetical protein
MISGNCLCRTICFQAELPSLFVAHCHCSYCREAHGAAFVTWVGLAQDRFRFAAGEADVRWYKSSPQSQRGFCTTCGTSLFFTSALCPGEIHVARSAFDTPLDREPELHCFFDQRVPWVVLGDALPRYDTTAPGLAKYRAIPPLRCP